MIVSASFTCPKFELVEQDLPKAIKDDLGSIAVEAQSCNYRRLPGIAIPSQGYVATTFGSDEKWPEEEG